ncbi:MAG: hypothetical protein RR014_06640, partial [Bilophila sp.]
AKDAGPVSDWISAQERVKGDKAVVESDKDFSVLLFSNRYLETYNAVSVRHILIAPETAETHKHVGDAPHSDDEFDRDAKAKAEATSAPAGKTSPRQPSVAFDQFLDAYPVAHRGGRAEAEREWVGLEHNCALPGINRLFDALGEWEASERWKAKGGQYIPTAANFLAREYWLQKPPTPEQDKPAARDGPRTPPQQFKTAKMAESEGRGRFAGNVLAMMNARELEEQEKKNGIISRHCGGIGQDLCALSAT